MGSVSTTDFQSTFVPLALRYLADPSQQQLEIDGGIVPSRESYNDNETAWYHYALIRLQQSDSSIVILQYYGRLPPAWDKGNSCYGP